MGLTITKRDGEYRVAYQGNVTETEPSAYYTNDVNDAVATARAMAIHQQLLKCGCDNCNRIARENQRKIKPHASFGYIRPDEVAECWENISSELYRALWESMSGEKPLSQQIDMENSSPCDAIGISTLASLWAKFTPEQQVQLNELALTNYGR